MKLTGIAGQLMKFEALKFCADDPTTKDKMVQLSEETKVGDRRGVIDF